MKPPGSGPIVRKDLRGTFKPAPAIRALHLHEGLAVFLVGRGIHHDAAVSPWWCRCAGSGESSHPPRPAAAWRASSWWAGLHRGASQASKAAWRAGSGQVTVEVAVGCGGRAPEGRPREQGKSWDGSWIIRFYKPAWQPRITPGGRFLSSLILPLPTAPRATLQAPHRADLLLRGPAPPRPGCRAAALRPADPRLPWLMAWRWPGAGCRCQAAGPGLTPPRLPAPGMRPPALRSSPLLQEKIPDAVRPQLPDLL